MRRLTVWTGLVFLSPWQLLAAEPSAPERAAQPRPLVRAEIRAERNIIQTGRPVWVEFSLTNLTSDPLTLRTPASPPGVTQHQEMGLPLAHIFSGPNNSAVSIKDSRGEVLDAQVTRRPQAPVPSIQLAPHASVGVRVDLSQYYDSLLHRPGKYTLVWRPYEGTVESAPLSINLMAERQAVILTRLGKMTMRFYYEEAPLNVANFIELVEQRFYDNLTFHKIIPGGLVQGGDPLGDGRGIRPDGKRVVGEFSRIPFDVGTVGTARLPSDPNSASCQFFICLSRQPSFDGQQTALGYLVGEESFETLRQIAATPTGAKGRPEKPVYIQTISLENVPSREREITISGGAVTRPATALQGRSGPEPSPAPRRPAATPFSETVTRLEPATRPESELPQ